MKALVLTLAAVAVLAWGAGSVLAADAPATATGTGAAATPQLKPHAPWWVEALGLTEEQKEQIKPIMKAAHEAAEKAPDLEAKRQIMRDAFEKIEALLTPEQKKKLAELRETPFGVAQERLQRIAEEVGLTPEQVEAARAILKAAHEEAEKSGGDREARMAIFRDALEKIRTTVLTDAQRQLLGGLREKMKGAAPAATKS